MKESKSGQFTLKRVRVVANGVSYQTYRLSGSLNGKRIRKHFKDRDEALGELNRLEVESANAGGVVRARVTRLPEPHSEWQEIVRRHYPELVVFNDPDNCKPGAWDKLCNYDQRLVASIWNDIPADERTP